MILLCDHCLIIVTLTFWSRKDTVSVLQYQIEDVLGGDCLKHLDMALDLVLQIKPDHIKLDLGIARFGAVLR